MSFKPKPMSAKLAPVITRRKRLERDLEHITQEMYQRNRELAETNQTLSLLQTISGLALDASESIESVSDQIANAVAETAGFPLVAVLTTASGSMRDIAVHGISVKSSKAWQSIISNRKVVRISISSKGWGESPTKLVSIDAISNEQLARVLGSTTEKVEKLRKQLGVQSLYFTELSARGTLVGLVVVGFYGYADQVRQQDLALIDRLSEPIGVALDNRLLSEENRHVLSQLRRSNAKLKSLDETKDEFISMASHQLRTPLTSVKGYLSMVLDGDAGPLNVTQKKLLEQSYRSSQQMVYLISDLLNLSRLNTGKFVIEPSDVDLSEIVQFEVSQLAETARARGISLHYDKPTVFPHLQLDETKTHQVIMNFIDNAIYYTKSGGAITVSLKESPQYVEYRVTDTGIGVPKAVQHKLFSKFYRADNAQKARPDGTGLGLFMAKKVIAAQGGAIIFESEEGKGSTFGFRLNKARHAVSETTHPKAETARS